MNKKISIVIWVAALVIILTGAYALYSNYKHKIPLTPPSSQSPETSQSSDDITVPDFSLKDLKGNTVKLSDYKGKIVILNFWAVWCKYCKQEMPDLNELNRELEKSNDAVILAVDTGESADTVRDYLSSNNISLKVLLNEDSSLAQSFGVEGFPTTFVIKEDGTLYTYIPYATDKETLKLILNKIRNGEPLN